MSHRAIGLTSSSLPACLVVWGCRVDDDGQDSFPNYPGYFAPKQVGR